MYRNSRASARTPAGRAKMSRAPQAGAQRERSEHRSPSARSHRDPVQVTLTWRTGGEPWVMIECRGERYIRPGTMPLFELVLWLNGWR